MNRLHSKKIKLNGRIVRYYTGGQGDPLVVIHGGGGDAHTWLKNADELIKNYTVYVPDLPGFGASQPLDGRYYIPEFTEFVESFTRALNLEKFYIMGHSVGGGIALNYSLMYPHKVQKLVLISSLCLGKEVGLWLRILSVIGEGIGKGALWVLRSIKWLIKTLLIPVRFVVPLNDYVITLGSSITTFKEQTIVLANRLSEIKIPTLVVWGARDPVVPVRHAYAAAEVIPDCQLKIFGNRGHNVHRDELQEFSHLLRGFLG
jgi:4,5:9,10-diseco-3-hydroxy-5,9,17-trioxoandrosta-1(10),2-diene-4-oate hydrolase